MKSYIKLLVIAGLAIGSMGASGGGCGGLATDGGSQDDPDMARPAPTAEALRCGEMRACIAKIAPGDVASEENCLKKLDPPGGPALSASERQTQLRYMDEAQNCERPKCQAENMSTLDPCDEDKNHPGQFNNWLNCIGCMSRLEEAGRCAAESANCPLPERYRKQ